jgi:putative FmdB family regulatory protein
MPIYEYRCANCGETTEVLVQSVGVNPSCSSCGSPVLEKLVSAPYVMSSESMRPKGRTCCGQEDRCATPPCSTESGCRRR